MRTGPATWFRAGAAAALIGALAPALHAATPVAIDLAAMRAADPDEVITLDDVDLGPGGFVDLELKRFRVTTPATRFVLGRHGGPDEPIPFDADDVVLLRGRVRDQPASRVLLVGSPVAGRGHVDLDGRRYELTLPGSADAPAPDPARLRTRVIRSRSSLPPDVPLCGAIAPPARTMRPAVSASSAVGVPGATTGVRVIELAIETDYEYYTLHEDAESAAAYVLELYGAVSDLYERDLDMRIEITFVRIWDDPDDLFNEPNPLGPFQTFWENNMTTVPRDAAQFLSGRRNLAWGGIAFVDAICTSSAYSVVGYVRGFFPDPSGPDPWHADIIVTAHELGHNLGSRHTHDYGLDTCNEEDGPAVRGTIMSYCSQTRSGGSANMDLRFHRSVQQAIRQFTGEVDCLDLDCGETACDDCNGNGVADATDIAIGFSLDLDGNGVPDDCQANCNENLFPDSYDIAIGLSIDVHGNGIPDECETDCDDDGVSDYTEIMADMSLDVNRNAILDACEDCDGDGVLDLDAVAGAHNVWIASGDTVSIREFHARAGVSMRVAQPGWISDPRDVRARSNGRILVTSAADDRVAQFDRFGTFLGDFVTAGSGGLSEPSCMAFSPVSGHLYVVSRDTHSVLEYHGNTGAFLRTFVAPGSGGLVLPFGLAFGREGDLFVTSLTNEIKKYDGATGAFLGTHVSAAANGGLTDPRGMILNTDRTLLVCSYGTDEVLRYDRLTGAFLGRFNQGGTDAVLTLDEPWCIRIGPDDNVYVSRHGVEPHPDGGPAPLHLTAARVYIFDWATGLYLRTLVTGNDTELWHPTGFDFFRDIAFEDCNRNGVPDDCDIELGTSLDTNANGFPDECECHADVDQDGEVGFNDLLIVINEWGMCPPVGAQCPPDVDGNGIINFGDIEAIIGAWGPCY